MGTRYRKQKELTYIDLRVGVGISLFVNRKMLNKMSDALKWCCEKRGLRIYEYVILPDRILLMVNVAWGTLPETVTGFKTFTSKAIVLMLRHGRKNLDKSWVIPVLQECSGINDPAGLLIWEQNNRSRSLYEQKQVDEHALFIHHAPVKCGIVEKPNHYLHSSANPRNPLEGWQVAVTDRGI